MEAYELAQSLRKKIEGIDEIWNGHELLTLDENGVPILIASFRMFEGGKAHERVYRYESSGIWGQIESSGKIDRQGELREIFSDVPEIILSKISIEDIFQLKKKWVVVYEKQIGEIFEVVGFPSRDEFKQELREAYGDGACVHSVYMKQKPIKYRATVNISLEWEDEQASIDKSIETTSTIIPKK